MISIIDETADHHDAVRQLTIDAFSASEFGHCGESELIEALRSECKGTVSLVALDDDRVVGHILFSPATIRCGTKTHSGMGLAPMAVLPSHQRKGVGSKLVAYGLQRLAELDVAFTVVAGHPEFYCRFGFVSAVKCSVTHGFAGMPQEILFLHVRDSLADFPNGLVYYHDAFGTQHDA